MHDPIGILIFGLLIALLIAPVTFAMVRDAIYGKRAQLDKEIEVRNVVVSYPDVDVARSIEIERAAVVEYLRLQVLEGGWNNEHRYDTVLTSAANAVELGKHVYLYDRKHKL